MVASARNSRNRTRSSEYLSTARAPLWASAHTPLASCPLHLPRPECARYVRGRIEGDQLPSFGSREQGARQGVVQPVTGFVGGVFADQRVSEQIQIADGVEHLVLGKFVVVTQPLAVQDARFIEHDRILQVAPQDKACGTQRLHVLHEAEGSSAADFLDVRMLGKIDRDVAVFRSEYRVREIDGEIEHEPLMWIEARPLVVLPRFDGRLDPQIAFGSRLLNDAGRLQQKDERPRASIHDRDLGTGNVDWRVSPTLRASAAIVTGLGRSVRWKTMPVSGGAGRSIISTRTPVCKPTPVDLILFLSVRCLSIIKPPARSVKMVRKRNGSRVYVMLTHPQSEPKNEGVTVRVRVCCARASHPFSRPACEGMPGYRQGRTPMIRMPAPQ